MPFPGPQLPHLYKRDPSKVVMKGACAEGAVERGRQGAGSLAVGVAVRSEGRTVWKDPDSKLPRARLYYIVEQ